MLNISFPQEHLDILALLEDNRSRLRIATLPCFSPVGTLVGCRYCYSISILCLLFENVIPYVCILTTYLQTYLELKIWVD
jgi:hypothetical protein